MTYLKPVYFENLDGLRFFAFLAVLISHAALFLGYNNNSPLWIGFKKYILVNGDVGVSFFFVLSGFLITYLLFKEKDNTGKISLKHFYIRRILRIWPVYFITLIVGFFVLPLFLTNESFIFPVNPSLSILPHYLFFLANFNLAFYGGGGVPTDVLWSISVEEQFYLIWPWVIAFLPRKHLLKFLSIVIMISCVYRYVYALSPNTIAYSTFSVMSDLAIGSMLALFVYTKNYKIEKIRNKLRSISSGTIASIYIIMFVLIFGRHLILNLLSQIGSNIFYNISVSIIPILLATLFAFVIFEQNESSKSLFKIGRFKKISFLGKISYGLYSYHVFAFIIVLLTASILGFSLEYTSTLQWLVLTILSLVSVFVLAIISYYGIERWFLKMKPKD